MFPAGQHPGIIGNPRLNPAGAALSSEAPVGDSSYESLQVGMNRRFSHGMQCQLSYTWSKCLDDASGTYGLEGGIPWSNPLNGSYDRGRCLFDRPQVFRLSGVYALPFKQNRLVSGWQMSGGLIAQSGSPWNVIIGFDQSGSAVATSGRTWCCRLVKSLRATLTSGPTRPHSRCRRRARWAICKETLWRVPAP